MRPLSRISIALAAAAALAGVAHAEVKPAAAPAKHASATAHHVVGQVVSASANRLVLKESVGSGAKEQTFAIEPATKITLHGKAAKADDIKAGESVTVAYTGKEGALTATSIHIAPAKATAAEKPAARK